MMQQVVKSWRPYLIRPMAFSVEKLCLALYATRNCRNSDNGSFGLDKFSLEADLCVHPFGGGDHIGSPLQTHAILTTIRVEFSLESLYER